MVGSVYCKFDGIDGESSASGFEGQCEIDSWSWGGHNGMSMDTGGRRTQGNADIHPLTLSKALDSASAELYKRVFGQEMIPKATLSITARYGNESLVYYEIILENVYVGDYTISGMGGESGDASESFGLYFSKAEWTYTKRDPADGSEKGDITGSFESSTGALG